MASPVLRFITCRSSYFLLFLLIQIPSPCRICGYWMFVPSTHLGFMSKNLSPILVYNVHEFWLLLSSGSIYYYSIQRIEKQTVLSSLPLSVWNSLPPSMPYLIIDMHLSSSSGKGMEKGFLLYQERDTHERSFRGPPRSSHLSAQTQEESYIVLFLLW